MGFCTELGPQIHAGCDQPMVAGRDSCSCPACEAVCTGKFPACAGVWARGPQPVNLKSLQPSRRMAMANGNGNVREGVNGNNPSMTNGARSGNSLASTEAVPLTADPVDLSALNTIYAEMSQLCRRIEQASTKSPPPSEAAEELQRSDLTALNSLLEGLPSRLAEAVSSAIARRDQLVIDEVRRAIKEFFA